MIVHLRTIFARYTRIHGPLLAKGLSFSFVLAGIPLLFFLIAIGSYVLKANLATLVEAELLGFLPEAIRGEIITNISEFVAHPGSLSIASVLIFMFVVNTLFFDLYRSASAALGTSFSPASGRLWATLETAVFVLLIYSATAVTLAARIISRYLPLSPFGITLGARVLATLIIAFTLWSMFRIAADGKIPFTMSFLVSVCGAVAWQVVSGAGSILIGFSGSRFVMYGVLAWAIFYLIYMRILSEIIIHCALWIHVLQKPSDSDPSRISGQSPPLPPDSR